MADVDRCRIVSVQDINPFSPILVNFEFGFDSRVGSSDLSCGLYIDPQQKEKRTVILGKKNKHFVGNVEPNELSRTFILVRNRKTNEARMFVTQSCTLSDSAKEEDKFKKKRAYSEKIEDDEEYFQKEHSLRLSFGSKKSKRSSNINMRLRRNLLTDKEEIINAISGIQVNLSDINSVNQGEDEMMKLLPSCNRSATRPEDVYKLENILTKNDINSLEPAVEFLLNNPLIDMDEKRSFFLYSHYSLLGISPESTRVALLLYGNSLVNFFNINASQMKNKESLKKICPQSSAIASKILNEFTVISNRVRTRPSYCKDKIVCYVMVATLLACNFKVNIETLSSCLKGFGQKKLIQLARVVGLTCEKDKQKAYVLQIPLPPLPKVRAVKKKSL